MYKLLTLLSGASVVVAQYPATITDHKQISLDDGRGVRFKEPQLCETTKGVKSYSGFLDVAEDKHFFFWFFESRRDPEADPVTLWLNGGPGADNMGGLFDEVGPCSLNEDLTTELREKSWNELSNLLFITQPVGVGFSYEHLDEISIPLDGLPDIPPEQEGQYLTMRVSGADYGAINTTELAADDMWDAIQTFYAALPELAPTVKSKTFHMGTQSYGGHWGPGFFNRFRKETEALGSSAPFTIGNLIIVNGITDAYLQYPSYPRFALENTHGVHIPQNVSDYMKYSADMPLNGCLALIEACESVITLDPKSFSTNTLCMEAQAVCRRTVEMPFGATTGSHNYDVRARADPTDTSGEPLPPGNYPAYLNIAEVQAALGVSANYTTGTNPEVYGSFYQTGDFAQRKQRLDLEELIEAGVRVALWYGDADWVCNWFGGEALSLGLNVSGAEDFAAAGYAPLMVEGKHYGDTRERGGFSFTRVFDAGHAAPWYQPDATFALFERMVDGKDLATGEVDISGEYATEGPERSTYNQTNGDGMMERRGLVKSAKFRMV